MYARLLKLVWDNRRKISVIPVGASEASVRVGIPLPEIIQLGSVLYTIKSQTIRRAVRDMASDNLLIMERCALRFGRTSPPIMLLSIPGDIHGRPTH